MKYTIKSTSKEGTYYLVNGWNKYKTFWLKEEDVLQDKEKYIKKFFNKPSQAQTSLTKLLKIMEEYRLDNFELIEIN